MEKKQVLSLSVDSEVLDRIDERRGLATRSRWVNEALKKLLGVTP
jgi:metal-responsive CopG/Arc/MetJ family transcriptional regulator